MKQKLRAHYREARRRHHETRDDHASVIASLSVHLDEILKLREADAIWATYMAHQTELDLAPSIASLQNKWPQIRWAYPRITETQSLEFRIPHRAPLAVGDSSEHWIGNSFSILEPNPETSVAVPLEDLTGVFVPAIAFDRFGNRVGSGKGYYDRALVGFRGLRVGVGYSVQISDDAFPAEKHDIQMDYLLTERGVVMCGESENRFHQKG